MIKHGDDLRKLMKLYDEHNFLESRKLEVLNFQKEYYNNEYEKIVDSLYHIIEYGLKTVSLDGLNEYLEFTWNNLFKGKDLSTKEKLFEVMSDDKVGITQICIQMFYYDRIGEAAHLINNLEILNCLPHKSILDFGCGVADYSLAFRMLNIPKEICICDIPGPILEFAKWRYMQRGLPQCFYCWDDSILEDKSKDGKFDFIIAAEVLEHLHNPPYWIQRFHDLLKPTGIFHASGYPMREKKLIGDHLKEAHDLRSDSLELYRKLFKVIKPNVKLYCKVKTHEDIPSIN